MTKIGNKYVGLQDGIKNGNKCWSARWYGHIGNEHCMQEGWDGVVLEKYLN